MKLKKKTISYLTINFLLNMKDKQKLQHCQFCRQCISQLVCLALMLLVCLHTNAQTTKVSLKYTNVTFEQVLNAIEKQTSFRFLFNKQQVDVSRSVSINVSGEEIVPVITQLLKGTNLGYRIQGNQIVLTKKNETAADSMDDVKKITAKGTVKDENGEPLVGATVVPRNFTAGTMTDIDGNFTLEVPPNGTLEISYVGYEKQTVYVKSKGVLSITMKPTTALQEVVVIGYGYASKRDVVGTITKINGEDILNRPNSNPIASLQGKVAGLSVVNSGKLNESPDVRIRSTVSLAGTSPLYIIDGIMNENMNMVSTSEIESIEILKDPSSLAIFGVRGANGVIIVTTKRGKAGKMTVSFNTSIGLKSIADAPQMTDRDQFITLFNEEQFNNGYEAYTQYDLYTANTNWVDVIKEPTPVVLRGNLNISHGSDNNRFYAGINYAQEKGLIMYERFKKIGITANDELKVNDTFKCGFGFNGYAASLPQNHDFQSALKSPPIVEPYNTEAEHYNRLPEGLGGSDIDNPLLTVQGKKYSSVASEYNFVPNIFAEFNLFKGLSFRMNYYLNFYTKQQRDYSPHTEEYNIATKASEVRNDLTSVTQFSSQNIKFQQEYLLTYKNSFKKHNLTLLAGLTTSSENYTEVTGFIRQYSDKAIPYDKRFWYAGTFPYGDPSTRTTGSDQYVKRTVSYLFRTLYNYDGRYMVNASFRRDGSTAISPSHRFQDFWALGGAWVMTEEKFMKEQHTLNNLKLKASIGQLGNQYTGSDPLYRFLYLATYEPGVNAVFGDKIVAALRVPFHPDPNLKWESVTSYETGFEADLLKSRLHVEGNYYYRKTKDLLTIITDQTTGDKYGKNAGSVRAKGLEFVATWSAKTLDNQLNYSLSGNISTINNKVLSVWSEGYKYISGARGQSITEAGHPIARFVGYEVDGIYQDQDEIKNGPDVSSVGISPGPGDLKFKDVSGPDGQLDGKIDDYDKTTIGNPTPKFTYGMSANLSFKGFDLNVDLQGVHGNSLWRDWGNRGAGVNIYNFRRASLARWTGLNTSNTQPRLYTASGWNNLQSSYFIEDGSYLRVRNVELGYSLPKSLAKKMSLASLRLFISAQNLKTWKHNSGFSPEAGGDALQFGIDDGGYPVPAVYTTGLNLTF